MVTVLPAISCPYEYERIRRTRAWVPRVKHALLSFHLAHFAHRWRGRSEWSDYTGGWNALHTLPSPSERRLNLGCGQAYYHGYINLDIVRWPHLHVQAEGQCLPFKSGSFDEVLCTDVIEHLNAEAGGRLLEETARVLQRGGHLILVTPDLDSIILAYRSHFATYDQTIQHLLGDARDHRYLYNPSRLAQVIRSNGLTIRQTIRHWGPIWAHMVILTEKT